MRRIRNIVLALLLAACLNAFGNDGRSYKFTHINTGNSGICYDGVSAIMQDSRGYVWIGTFNGLNRFDGSRFEVYHKAELGLDSDFIHTILEDQDGNLWIGTDKGLTRYIWTEDRFEAFTLEAQNGSVPRNKITCIYQDDKSCIWIFSNYQGCFCFNPGDGTLVNYRSGNPSGVEHNTDEAVISFRRIVSDGQGGFWVSKYHSGLFHADGDLSHLNRIETPSDPRFYASDEIERLWMISDRLVVASNLHGISVYDPRTGDVRTIFSLPEGVTLVDAFLHEERWVYLSTTDGVWKCDLQCREKALHFNSDPDNFSISGNYVFATFVDREGGLWIGTKDGGISYSGALQYLLGKVTALEDGRSLEGAIVNGFAESPEGEVWVSTEQMGLLKYDPRRQVALKVRGLPDRLCKSCWWGGRIWVGSLEGLYSYNPSSGRVRHYGPLKRQSGATDPRVYIAYPSPDGDLYFTNTLGMFRYREEDDSMEQIGEFDGVFITSMAQAPDGTIWVSSFATGLFQWDPNLRQIIRTFRQGDGSGLPSDKISSVFIDSSGDVWVIGFSCGIARLEGDGFSVIDSSTLPSLPSDVFFCAEQDNDSYLWLTGDRGVVQLNPRTLGVNVYKDLDGLVDSKTTNSILKSSSGEIFIGSDNGFVHFDPSRLAARTTPPAVRISKMTVGNRSVEGNLNIRESVRLKNNENSFGFEFSLMSLSLPATLRVKCKLEGYDSEWIDASAEKSVHYYNIPSGRYTLRLMSSGAGNEWAECGHALQITVMPKFFASFWGILTLFFIFFALLWVASLIIRHNRTQERIRDAERIRKESEEEAFRDKMNFFSHVVHEIKTPLTLIRTPLQSVMGKDQLDDEARHDLEVICKNSDYLTSLVNELLEFVRVERQGYVLQREELDLTQTLDSLMFNYSDSASNRNIRMTLSAPDEHIWINADAAALGKILNNLLINAFKYTESYIGIALCVVDGRAQVDISNDGAPIPSAFREDIFRPFVQYKGSSGTLHKGFGIGLPLARSLARMHSGELELLPDEDRTVFRFSIASCPPPPAASDHHDSAENSGTDAPTVSEGSRRSVVLVVDDNEQMREFLVRKLGRDMEVLTASNSDSALSVLKEREVDLMVSDISMPGRDGLQLCEAVRSDVEISHMPVIILSARTSVQSKIQAMEAGADLYIEKPFDLDYLKSSIRNILDRRTLMRSAFNTGIGQTDISIFGLPKRDEQLLAAFDKFVSDNIGDSDLSNEKIAEALCMSQSMLVRKIRKLLDTSPNNYIRVKRLNAAASMLKDSNGNNITEICYAVGFSNVSYFAKCFKDQFGMTPSEWASSVH